MNKDTDVLLLFVPFRYFKRKFISNTNQFQFKSLICFLLPIFEIIKLAFITAPISHRCKIIAEAIFLYITIGNHPVLWHRFSFPRFHEDMFNKYINPINALILLANKLQAIY